MSSGPGRTAPSRVPLRSCLGCRERHPQSEMVRLRREGEQVVVDGPGHRGPGRGAYVCAKMECWLAARRRRAVPRALRLPAAVPVPAAVEAAFAGMISNSARPDPPEATTGPVKEGIRSPS